MEVEFRINLALVLEVMTEKNKFHVMMDFDGRTAAGLIEVLVTRNNEWIEITAGELIMEAVQLPLEV